MKKLLLMALLTMSCFGANYYVKSNSYLWVEQAQAIDGGTTNSIKEFVENNVTGTVASAKFLGRNGDTAGDLTVTNLTAIDVIKKDSGLNSISISGGSATANYSTAIGTVATFGADESIKAYGIGSFAVGSYNLGGFSSVSTASGDGSTAINGGIASGLNSIALNGTASGTDSVSIRGTASGERALALGGTASGKHSFSAQNLSAASGERAVAFAGGTASGKDSFCVTGGGGANASGERSVSFGGLAYGFASFAVADAHAYGSYSVSMADGRTYTTDFGNVAANLDKLDDGGNSVAFAGGRTFGRKCFAVSGLTSIGQTNMEMSGYADFTVASNDYAVAIGMGSVATGVHSMALMGAFAGRDDMVAMPDTDIQGVLNMTGNQITNAIYRGDTNKFPDIAWEDLGGSVDLTTISNQFLLKTGGVATNLTVNMSVVPRPLGAANVQYVDDATNACLQSADAIAMAGAQGVWFEPDGTGSNGYFSSVIPGLTFTSDVDMADNDIDLGMGAINVTGELAHFILTVDGDDDSGIVWNDGSKLFRGKWNGVNAFYFDLDTKLIKSYGGLVADTYLTVGTDATIDGNLYGEGNIIATNGVQILTGIDTADNDIDLGMGAINVTGSSYFVLFNGENTGMFHQASSYLVNYRWGGEDKVLINYRYGNVNVANDISVADDLFVDDFASLDSARIGATATDPGTGNLYIEGDITSVDKVYIGGMGSNTYIGATSTSMVFYVNGSLVQELIP